MKTLNEVKQDIINGKYANLLFTPDKKVKEGHVFDEEQTVKWNREQVKIFNDDVDLKKDEYRRKNQEMRQLMTDDIINAMVAENKNVINYKQAEMIYYYSYQEHHAYSISEVINHLDEYIDLYYELKKIETKDDENGNSI